MRPLATSGIAALGAGLIAIGYGLARFIYGLFVPMIRQDLGLSAETVGAIGALAFTSYVLAIAVAPLTVERLGARATAATAAAFATVGLMTISSAPHAAVLAVGVFTCGISTGLLSPALVAVVETAVPPGLHSRVNTVINAGTCIGVAGSVPAAMMWPESWRAAYAVFAAVALGGLVAAWLYLPGRAAGSLRGTSPLAPIRIGQWHRLAVMGAFAFGTGVVSAPYWVFAPDLVVALGSFTPGITALIWVAVGAGGLLGGMAGDLVERHGMAMTHGFGVAALAASLSLLAANPGALAMALISAAVFGATYIGLTGVYLVGGVGILPGRPALGPVLPFLALSLGQVVGSPLAGIAIGRVGYQAAFGWFCVLGLLMAIHSPLMPSRHAARDPGPTAGECA